MGKNTNQGFLTKNIKYNRFFDILRDSRKMSILNQPNCLHFEYLGYIQY